MKVRARVLFVGLDLAGRTYRYSAGDVFDLPDRVDWLQAGLVEPIKAKRETATVQAAETATVGLEQIDGIGAATVRALADLGIATMADLAQADPDALAEIRGITRERAEQMIRIARARGIDG